MEDFVNGTGLHLGLQFSSVAQSCLILCDAMNRSTPGCPLPTVPSCHPVHHQLPEFTQLRGFLSCFSKENAGFYNFLGDIAVGIPLKRRYNKMNVAFKDERRFAKHGGKFFVHQRFTFFSGKTRRIRNAQDSDRRTEV